MKRLTSESIITETYEGGIFLVRFPIITVDHAAVSRDGGYAAMLQQAYGEGCYCNPDITPEAFPVSGDGLVYIEPALLAFGRNVSSKEVCDTAAALESDSSPWAVGELAGLCAFTGAHPDLQRANPIPALGSVAEVHGGRYVPYPTGDGADRKLYLSVWDGDWHADFRFFVVRNASKPGARASA